MIVQALAGICSTRKSAPSGVRIIAVAAAVLAYVSPPVAGAQGETKPPPSDAVVAPPSTNSESQYIIGPGDTIQIFVWRNPELSVTVPVRPDGKISTPLVDDLVAVGKTPVQLARDIETKLADYVRSPQVNVIVTQALSTFNQVKVIGQVKSPQAVAYRDGMTALDVVLAVGGLTDFAAGNRAKLIRKDAQGRDIEIKVHLQDLVEKGKISENVPVKPGDLLVVPEARF
jgi:polysaccharide biosynthesis/export protein